MFHRSKQLVCSSQQVIACVQRLAATAETIITIDGIKPRKQESVTGFAQLLRNSKFVSLGNLENPLVVGKVVDVIGDDVHVDYGGKFNAICKNLYPERIKYKRNENVRIRLKSFEMAAYFINSARSLTLMESDADLIGHERMQIIASGESDKHTSTSDERRTKLLSEVDELNSDPYY